MVDDQVFHMSQARLAEFREELERLRTTKRKELSAGLEAAIALGDLKENSEYHALKREKLQTENRIAEIEHMIRNVAIVNDDAARGSDSVVMGSVVTLTSGDTVKKVTIVGPQEVDILADKVSNESPLGSVLMGKHVGDIVTVESPKGKLDQEIADIS